MPKGISLLQLLITISIISLLLLISAGSLTSTRQRLDISGASQSIYFFLQQARSQAITNQHTTTVAIQAGKKWCLGLTDSPFCNCTLTNDCKIGAVEQVLSFTDYPFTTLDWAGFGPKHVTQFDGQRGLSIGHAGTLTLQTSKFATHVIVSNMGRVRICSKTGDIGSYRKC